MGKMIICDWMPFFEEIKFSWCYLFDGGVDTIGFW